MKNPLPSSRLWSKVLLFIMLCAGALQATAADPVDLGALELGKVYELQQYAAISATFTPEQSGTLLKDGGAYLTLYTDPAHTESSKLNGVSKGYGQYGQVYTYEVTAGTTYYLYTGFNMNKESMKLSMGGGEDFSTSSVKPADGSSFSHDADRQVVIVFSTAVSGASASLKAGDKTGNAYVSVNGMTMWVDIENTVRNWCEDGTLKEGDEFTLNLTNIKSALSGSLLNGDGKLTLTYKSTGKSTKLLTSSVPSVFKSYFAPTDPEGIVTLTFDNDLDPASGVATIGYGDLEGESGEYYYEELPLTINGRTLTVDLTGKLRRAQDMVTSATLYETIGFGINNLKDASGKFVAGGGAAQIGSFSWAFPYKEVARVDVSSEFTPSNGGSLEGVSSVEVWINGISAITFDGFRFSYPEGEETKSVDVPMSQITREDEGTEAAVFNVPVPASVAGKKNVTLAPYNIVSNDGLNHSRDVFATYDGFAILSSIPANGETFSILPEGYNIQIVTNYAEKYPEMYVVYEIEDMNPDDPEEAIVKNEAWMNRQEDGSYKAEIPLDIKLVLGHEYCVRFTAWATESDKNYQEPAIGSAYVMINGSSAPFIPSDVTLMSIDPAEGSQLGNDEVTFTITFDGMVHIRHDQAQILLGSGMSRPFDKLEPVEGADAAGNGLLYSNIWKLTIDKSFMESKNDGLQISIAATDVNGRVVQGNTGKGESSYFIFSYPVAGMYTDFTVNPKDNDTVTSLFEIIASSDLTIGLSYAMPVEDAVVTDAANTVVAHVISAEPYSGPQPRAEGDDKEEWEEVTALKLTLDKEIDEAGTYTLTIPAGYFLVGDQYEARKTVEKICTYIVTGNGGKPAAIEVDPAEGHVASLSSIRITFTEEEEIAAGSGKATITRQEDGKVYTLPDLDIDWDAPLNVLVQPVGETISEDGVYDFCIPAGYISCGSAGTPCQEAHFFYYVGNVGVELITPDADGLFNVFSLSGVLVKRAACADDLKELPAGIYIMNGTKIVIR